ncbi:hypothetical protein CIG75_14095 [Tumebacillus algifaecis]|uniref:Uncharacterized protein n=1 Tax=Tumebacillus algifaecis TaxID=1214604 RepID=A0A223D319_9BACL|nr:DUF1292 domain-containing protein [Tumebacillus algifaecis]ASS75980.1 hypothetical protein CIG75_14095 [Tumebacillus algifaecis]
MEHHKFQFIKGREFAFFHEDVHLLLIDFERDEKKEIFRIDEQKADGTYILEYPGELYIEQIKELISSIFFVQVNEEHREGRYAMGAYFTCQRKEYALFYDRENLENHELIFFRAAATGTGDYELSNVTDQDEYREVVEHMQERYGHFFTTD